MSLYLCSFDLTEQPVRHIEEPLHPYFIVHGVIGNKRRLVGKRRIDSVAMNKDLAKGLIEAIGWAGVADLKAA